MKHKIKVMAIISAVLLPLTGQGTALAAKPTVEYTYCNAEEAIPVVPDSDFVLINSSKIDGIKVTGMTDGYVYDNAKGKDVRCIGFKKKPAGENTKGAAVVRASLDGFAKYMTDPDINTISFDYKLSGPSDGALGMFMGANVDDYGDQLDTAILIGNKTGINVRPKINRNEVSDWYAFAINKWEGTIEATPNNREWNRITIEINKKNGEVSSYLNGEFFSFDTNTGHGANPPTDMNSFLFQTAAGIENDGDLSILFDNIKVYPGKTKYTSDSAYEGKWSFATGLVLDGFGFANSAGEMITEVQSDVCVKTTLSNQSEKEMKALLFMSGYKDGVMESVDLKMCIIDAGASLVIDNDENTIALNPEKEYDRIQLRILDGESGYPLIESREISKSAE